MNTAALATTWYLFHRSEVLQRVSEVSHRLLQRNEARRTARAFLESLRDKKADAKKGDAPLERACSSVWVTYTGLIRPSSLAL